MEAVLFHGEAAIKMINASDLCVLSDLSTFLLQLAGTSIFNPAYGVVEGPVSGCK